MKVTLFNPMSGESRQVKVGFSWTLLFFSGFLGIPQFLRKLNSWGLVALLSSVMSMQVYSVPNELDRVVLQVMFALLYIGISVWLGICGNRMTALALLERGWQFSHPNDSMTRLAKHKWSLLQTAMLDRTGADSNSK